MQHIGYEIDGGDVWFFTFVNPNKLLNNTRVASIYMVFELKFEHPANIQVLLVSGLADTTFKPRNCNEIFIWKAIIW